MRVVNTDGTQLGIMSRNEALRMTEDKELDLVCIAPKAKPPVCKLLDYGKYRYEQQKKEKEARKKQKTNALAKGTNNITASSANATIFLFLNICITPLFFS